MDMYQLINKFPADIIEGLNISANHQFQSDDREIRDVLICGMGGSGFAGKLAIELVSSSIKVPVTLCQDYFIPNYISKNTLVIGLSYSGNTEETLAAISAGLSKGAKLIGVASGGALEQFCIKNSLDFVKLPSNQLPRTALGFSLIQVLNILSSFNICEALSSDRIHSAANILKSKSESIRDKAAAIANELNENQLVIYCQQNDESLAIRARQQFNENAKLLCWHHNFPEMNHNELVGWAGAKESTTILLLDTNNWSTQNKKRLTYSKKIFKEYTSKIIELNADESIWLNRELQIIHLIDWISYYLSEKRKVDPIEVDVIQGLKQSLKQ